MTKILKPIFLSKKNTLLLNKVIIKYLYDVLYTPLVDIYNDEFESSIKLNSVSNRLLNALKRGTISLKGDKIYGNFKDAKLVQELQRLGYYNKRSKYFILNEIPTELIEASTSNKIKLREVENRFDSFLNEFIINIDNAINFVDIDFNETIDNYNKQFLINFKDLGIKPQLTEKEKELLNQNYINTTKYDIKNLSQRTIADIRQKLAKLRLEEGITQRDFAKLLQNNYKLTKNRSLFIARQESSLLLTEYSKNNYLKNGIRRFEWQTAGDELVRNYPINNDGGGNHKYLDGKIFEFSNPPVVNLLTGKRGLPGSEFNCYSKDTELLTKDGFKLIKDVKVGEKIATINPKTKIWEWSICTNTFKKYQKYIYNFNNGIFNLDVSENHTFFYYKNKYRGKKQIKEEYPVFTEGVRSLSKKNTRFLATANWKGEDLNFIYNIPTEIFCKFMGYYLSDGNIDKRTNNCIHITQNNNDWMFNELKDFLKVRQGKEKLYIYNKDLFKLVKPLGYCNKKSIPEIIKNLDKKYIRIFLNSFACCDGTPAKKIKNFNGNKELNVYNKYFTTSKQMMADLVECIYKTGMSTSVYIQHNKDKEVQFKNGKYKLNYDVYIIQELKTTTRDLNTMKISLKEYDDYVYDIEVKDNHTLLIKNDKSIHWNSNCRCLMKPVID